MSNWSFIKGAFDFSKDDWGLGGMFGDSWKVKIISTPDKIVIEGIYGSDTDLEVIINECINKKINQSTIKLLKMIQAEFAKNENKRLIEIPLKKYMKIMGFKDEKEARKTAEVDIFDIGCISVKAYKHKSKRGDFEEYRICSRRGIENGIIYVKLYDKITNNSRQYGSK